MKHNEDQLQMNVAQYLNLKYKKVLWWHTANERKTSPQRGRKFKNMGVKAGVPDILIFDHNHLFRGLAIELKIKPNKPTTNQLEVLSELEDRDWQTEVCYDFDSACKIIDIYLNNEL